MKEEAKKNNNKYVLESVIVKFEAACRDKGNLKHSHVKTERSSTNVRSTFQTRTNIICRNCGQKGHIARVCRNKRKFGVWCYVCGKDGHRSFDCNQNKSTTASKDAVVNQTNVVEENNNSGTFTVWSTSVTPCVANKSSIVSKTVSFCVDSGSTKHAVNDKKYLTNINDLGQSYTIQNSFGGVQNKSVVGEVLCSLKSGQNIKLTEVIDGSGCLKSNLLSCRELRKKGIKPVIEVDRIDLVDSTGTVVAVAPWNGAYYQLDLQVRCVHDEGMSENSNDVYFTNLNSVEVWHNRFGHIGLDSLKFMKNNSLVHGLSFKDSEVMRFCDGCNYGNIKRDNVLKDINYEKSEVFEAKSKLEKLHLDTVGPFEVLSRDGFRGFVSVTDAFTNYRWVIFIRSRDEVPDKLIKLIKNITNKFDCKVKVLHSDQGTEFVNKKLISFCEEEGISREYSAQYTPEQNGVAERSNGLIQEGLRTMLLYSRLGKSYWSYIASTKVYLLNRSRVVKTGKTPYEMLTGKKPNVKHLRIVGSTGYAKDLKSLKTKAGKLNPRGVPIVMLGYAQNQKGYIVLNANTRKVEITTNARFDETSIMSRSIVAEKLKKPVKLSAGNKEKEVKYYPELDFYYANKKEWDDDNENDGNDQAEAVEEPEVVNYETASEVDSEADSSEVEKPKTKNHNKHLKEASILGAKDDGVQTRKMLKEKLTQAIAAKTILRTKHTTNSYFVYQTKCEEFIPPKHYNDLSNRLDGSHWDKAYDKETEKQTTVGKMKVVKRPKGVQVIPLLELFTKKFDNITLENIYKVRFVARGDLEHGNEDRVTYTVVASLDVIRLIVAIAVKFGFVIRQADVSTAFLYGLLDRTIYVQLPAKLREKYGNEYVWSTNRSIYGLTDAPRAWNSCLNQYLLEYGFVKCPVEESLYYFERDDVKIYLIIYVDDMLYMGNNGEALDMFEEEFQEKFALKISRKAEKFVGMNIEYHDDGIKLHQGDYAKKILKTFESKDSKKYLTPLENKLVMMDEGKVLEDTKLYQSIVGALLYLNQGTRPDLSYSVNQLSKFTKKPTLTHLKNAKRVVKYLNGIEEKGLLFKKRSTMDITVYVDAEYGRHQKGKSVYGYVIMFNDTPIMFKTKQQDSSSLSSTEAEFIGISETGKQLMWLKNMLEFMKLKPDTMMMLNDNKGSINIAKSVASCKRTRHVELRHFWIRELLDKGEFGLEYVSTHENVADTMTKSLTGEKFEYFRSKMLN